MLIVIITGKSEYGEKNMCNKQYTSCLTQWYKTTMQMGILIWINTAKDLTACREVLLNPKLNFGKNIQDF